MSSPATTPTPPEPGRVWPLTAFAGPLFSLLLGLVVPATTHSAGRGFGRLVWLWPGPISMQNFFGYLFIAPVARGATRAGCSPCSGRRSWSTSSPSWWAPH